MVKATVPDPVSNALQARLREAVDQAGSVPKFSQKSGIPKDTLNKYLAGSQPGPAALVRIATAADISVDELLGRASYGSTAGLMTDGPEPKPREHAVGQFLVRASEGQTVPDGFVAVPYLEVRASAGGGRVSLPAETVAGEHFLFGQAWLRSLGVVPERAELLQASGDSMYPTIQDGDLMLVDRGYGEVMHGKVYALVVNGLVVVKRVHFLAAGGMILLSDNEAHPSETIRRDEVNQLSFQGRIVWYGRAI